MHSLNRAWSQPFSVSTRWMTLLSRSMEAWVALYQGRKGGRGLGTGLGEGACMGDARGSAPGKKDRAGLELGCTSSSQAKSQVVAVSHRPRTGCRTGRC